jgi:hypothetical protein
MKAGSVNWIEAQVGMSLEPGDIVKSGDNSSAETTFVDISTVESEAGTEIEFVSLNISTESDSAMIRVGQTVGGIIFRVIKVIDPASRYEVETPAGEVAVNALTHHLRQCRWFGGHRPAPAFSIPTWYNSA